MNHLSDKGLERRDSILRAARTIFSREGYNAAKLTDISSEAQCSVGTLYTYFESRDELLEAVLTEVQNEMLEATEAPLKEGEFPAALSATNRAYFESYRANAKEMGLLEEAAHQNAAVREFRLKRIRKFSERHAAVIEELIEQGIVTKVEDPLMTSTALSATMTRLAYLTWVEGYFPDTAENFERITRTADYLWLSALGLPTD